MSILKGRSSQSSISSKSLHTQHLAVCISSQVCCTPVVSFSCSGKSSNGPHSIFSSRWLTISKGSISTDVMLNKTFYVQGAGCRMKKKRCSRNISEPNVSARSRIDVTDRYRPSVQLRCINSGGEKACTGSRKRKSGLPCGLFYFQTKYARGHPVSQSH